MPTSFKYTKDMEDNFESRTRLHISLVQKYCNKIHAYDPVKFKGIVEAGRAHDASKFEEPERIPYIFTTEKYRCKNDGIDFKGPEGVDDFMHSATEHHVKGNMHHPEHWSEALNKLDRGTNPSGPVDAKNMPTLAIAEMVADSCAMSEELGNSPKDWADKNIGVRWVFTSAQKDLIYSLIEAIWSDKDQAIDKQAAASSPEAHLLDKPVTLDSLMISFHEPLFDYYLRAPGQPDGHYVVEIGEQKAGFGSKYQLRKFMEFLKEERFSDGIIPPLSVKTRPIPDVSEPVVRRLGTKVLPVKDESLSEEDHAKRLRGQEQPNYNEISDGSADQHAIINVRPTGPMF
jgi:hypothetical protein